MDRILSVMEYASLTGKDPGNIRRMLAAGRMEGTKVGKQWVIPFGAVYPEDRREKTGKYKNWRKRSVLNANKDLMKIVKTMVGELADIYGDALDRVVLYGSYARGEQTEDSDVDIALILNNKPSREMTKKMVECTAISELKAGRVLSVIDIEKDKYDNWKNVLPFYKNIGKEGIVLWQET